MYFDYSIEEVIVRVHDSLLFKKLKLNSKLAQNIILILPQQIYIVDNEPHFYYSIYT